MERHLRPDILSFIERLSSLLRVIIDKNGKGKTGTTFLGGTMFHSVYL